MKEMISANLNNPKVLERIYRENREEFRREFNSLYPELSHNELAEFWNERLNYNQETIPYTLNLELLFVVFAALIAGFTAKIPLLFGVDSEFFYPRNIGFIVFPVLISYFIWKQNISWNRAAGILGVLLISLLYINLIPLGYEDSDTLILACIHLPLLLWSCLGYTYTGKDLSNISARMAFLRYNGDLVVMSAVLILAGIVLSAVTMGLFEVIGINIATFYIEYIGIMGLAAIPMVATYLVKSNPQLVGKVSPVVARVFTPLVLITLSIYLAVIIYMGKNPFSDREFLIVFNILLIGVMSIIFFSIAESEVSGRNRAGEAMLLLLSFLTVIINSIAIAAIIFRINEWGITPNRFAVLGGNLLMLIHLLLISFQLLKVVRNRNENKGMEKVIAAYLPVYGIWTIIVVFLLPMAFGFK